MNKENLNGEMIIYQSEDGSSRLEVKLEDETVWLNVPQLMDLFHSSRSNVLEHIKNIYLEGELDKESTRRKFRQVQLEGNREVKREIIYYNLDMIISYRFIFMKAKGKCCALILWEGILNFIQSTS